MKSTDLLDLLRRHYIADEDRPAGIFAPEIGAPNSSRRADLIWQATTASSGKPLIGHEIKVDRRDLINELADPTKSDPWQRYCNRWWLVVPHRSLIEGLELPPTWGVLTPPSGRRRRSMTVEVEAPELKPDEQTPAVLRLAEWLHWRLQDERREHQFDRHQLERAREELHTQVPDNAASVGREHQLVAEIVAGLGGVGLFGEIGRWDLKVEPADVIEALLDLGSVRHQRDQARHTLDRSQEQLRTLRMQIGSLLKDTQAGAA